MKRQSVGVVLCALLLTTFGHELLNRHHISHSAKIVHHPQVKHSFLSRTHTKQHCVQVCTPIESTNNLAVNINGSAHMIGISNETSKIGLVIDAKDGFVGIVNLSTTVVIILNLKTKVAAEVSEHWEPNVSGPSAFAILCASGLQALHVKGQKISNSKIEVFVQEVLAGLSSGEYKFSTKEAIDALIEISNSLVVSLKVVFPILNNGRLTTNTSLKQIVEVLGGLANVVANIKGGVQVLVKLKLGLCLKTMLAAHSSLEIAGYLFKELAAADIEHIFDLQSSSCVLKLIAELGGNSTQGVNGLVTVLLEVTLIIHGKGSAEKLIAALIGYFSSGDHSVGEEFKAAVSGLLDAIKKLNLTVKLKVVVELLQKILDGKWIEENIDISAIIAVLTTAKDNDGLNVIALVLVLLQAKISIELAIATLVLHFIQLLAIQGGIRILVIITGIQVGAEYLSGSASALVHILKGISLKDFISGSTSGVVKFLEHLPVIGDLIAAINAAFKTRGQKQTVESSFTVSVNIQIVSKIRTCIQGVLGPHPIPIPIFWGLGPVRLPAPPNGTESAGGNLSIGVGGDGGAGGNSSGNAGSTGNSGNITGGEGSGNNVSVSGNSGGNVDQSGGQAGDGGDGTGGAGYDRNKRASNNIKSIGKHFDEHKPEDSGKDDTSTEENGSQNGGDGGTGGNGGSAVGGNGGSADGGSVGDGNDRHRGKGKHARHYSGKHHSNEKHL